MTFHPAERLRNIGKSAIRRVYDGAPPGSINLGLGEPDFRTPDVIIREARRVLDHEPVGYTANAGLLELRQRVAAFHSEHSGNSYSTESVCVTNGAQEALFAIMTASAGPGDEILLPNPGFLAYPSLAEIAGATVARYELPASHRFALDRSSFEKAVNDRTRLVFVHSPSNPTGQVLTSDDLAFMARCLSGSNAYVVSDEIYRELYYGERPPSIADYCDRTIVVSGLSKMMSMTGWRIGWAIGPEDVIRHITVAHQYISTCASAISQRAGIAAFSEEGRAATARFRAELGDRQSIMMSALEESGLEYVRGDGAFYIMLDVSQFGASDDVAMSLLRERVITVPGSAFGSQGEGYLRLSFSVKRESIQEGVRRIARGLGSR